MRRTAILIVVGLGLVSCTGDGTPVPIRSQSASPIAPTIHLGGNAVFGAEQWPQCVNPINACASSAWAHYTVLQHVLPRAMQLDTNGSLIASPLLQEAPTLDNGGLAQNPFSVRFRISPEAVWDDGSPITSADLRFTWLAQINTRGVYASSERREYRLIRSVETPDPGTAVVRFRTIMVDWADLFGGVDQYVLKAAAFPGADPKHPDLSREMKDSIPFSGGPFKLESWNSEQAVLVRNENYFGPHALLDRVTFARATDQEAETYLLAQGTVAAIYPTMGMGGAALDELTSNAATSVVTGDGSYFEALWFNHSFPPLDDPHVREALMYAIDRQAVVDQIVKPWNPRAEVLDCGLVASPSVGPWCQTRPFERFRYDPQRARAILEADGYTCVAAPCTRNGKVLEIPYSVNAGSVRRTTAQQVIIDHALPAGFSLIPRNYDTSLFSGFPNYPLADYAQWAEVDPSVTQQFACGDFRNRRNPVGDNWTNWCDPAAERLMRDADGELDPVRRAELMNLVYQIQALDFMSLPLYMLPAVSAWRTDRITGPIGAWNSSPYGLFFNMDQWYLP